MSEYETAKQAFQQGAALLEAAGRADTTRKYKTWIRKCDAEIESKSQSDDHRPAAAALLIGIVMWRQARTRRRRAASPPLLWRRSPRLPLLRPRPRPPVQHCQRSGPLLRQAPQNSQVFVRAGLAE